jgi:hypothetical protein
MTFNDTGILPSLRRLAENCGTLFKLEAELATLEMKKKAERSALLSGFAVGGGVIAIVGIGLLLLGFATVLAMVFVDDGIETSLGALGAAQIIIAVLTVFGGALCSWISFRKLKGLSLIPRRAVNQIRHDVNRLSSAVRTDNQKIN